MYSSNPFIIKGYKSKNLFCDREKELQILYENIKNGRDITLISPRRMGKTGLIFRFFEHIKEVKDTFSTLYVDIYASRSLADFVKMLSEAILNTFSEKTSFGKKFMQFIKGFRPLISFDPITNQPQISISYQNVQEKEQTLKSLFEFLDAQNQYIIVAIDEFQQISEYPEQNMEALLRTFIQPLKNINFIFCGSKQTLMLELFNNANRPFFGMTQFMNLDKINNEKYAAFISNLFAENHKIIDNEAIKFILDWTCTYTYYTQMLCNTVFAISSKNIEIQVVKIACNQLLEQNQSIFLQYRQLLTPAQWNFLIAVAKEGKVEQLTAQKFLSRYNIGTPANAKRLSDSLINKDLILSNATLSGVEYQVYDLFLSRWLQSVYQ